MTGTTGRPLRVLQVLATSDGGTARHVARLAAGLGQAGDDVVVAAPAATSTVLTRAGAPAGWVPLEVAARPRPRDVAAVARLARLARGRDVVHAHGMRAGAVAAVALALLPARRRPVLVVTVHNAPPAGRAGRLHALLEGLVVRRARALLGVSSDLVERLRGLGAGDVARALVPAPLPAPAGHAADPAGTRRALGLPAGAALVVVVARLAAQKGLPLLLDAAQVLAADPRRHLLVVVAGGGPLEGDLRARIEARQLPVRLLGRRDDVPDLLAAADVVVSPSVWEGQPIAVQEALRAGAAVVATDVGGTSEVTGDAAVLVPYGDPAALARAVAALLDDPGAARALRAAARRRAAVLPTDDDALAQVRTLYRRLLDAPRAPAAAGDGGTG